MKVLTRLIGILVVLIICLASAIAVLTFLSSLAPQDKSDSGASQDPSAIHDIAEGHNPQPDDGGFEYTRRQIWVDNDGQRIFGIAYIPITSGSVPLVILSPGLNSTYESVEDYAEVLARHGYGAYVFDFRGGSEYDSRSDGSSTEMSVITEESDLEAVVRAARDWDFVDPQRIILLGESQGGLVTALYAADHPSDVAGMVLFYPAFRIVEELQRKYNSEDDVPDEFVIPSSDITVGKNYITDMWDVDVYDRIGDYKGSVLIVHGTDDDDTDISQSEKASEVYDNCRFESIEGAGHGFYDEEFDESCVYLLDYLKGL